MSKTVWTKGPDNGREVRVYHTDPDCQALAHAAEQTETTLAAVVDDATHCNVCQGNHTGHEQDHTHYQTLRRLGEQRAEEGADG